MHSQHSDCSNIFFGFFISRSFFGLRNSLFKGDLYMKWKFGSITKQESSKSLIARISLIECFEFCLCHLVFVFRCCIFTDFPCYDVQQTRNKQIENASVRWWTVNVDECFNKQNWWNTLHVSHLIETVKTATLSNFSQFCLFISSFEFVICWLFGLQCYSMCPFLSLSFSTSETFGMSSECVCVRST